MTEGWSSGGDSTASVCGCFFLKSNKDFMNDHYRSTPIFLDDDGLWSRMHLLSCTESVRSESKKGEKKPS